METISTPDLSSRRVLVPGGSGGVGEGVVRAFLAAGADVVVPTRTAERGEQLQQLIGDAAPGRLHTATHDYTSFDGASALVDTMLGRLGGIDDVVAPIGGWWAGGPLQAITQVDWVKAFVDLATTHMAIARAALPQLSGAGGYTLIVGQSAQFPVPGSGLVSMQQAALLMMQQVLAAESVDQRITAFVLGAVRTRFVDGEAGWVSADQIGAVATALTASSTSQSGSVQLADSAAAKAVLTQLRTAHA